MEIERLYHAALERDVVERGPFLSQACGGDEALRGEVESLLQYHPKADAFLETPTTIVHGSLLAVANVLRHMHDSSMPERFVGQALGPYEIEALIAAGGMGEVYRAVDRRLDRIVAIKILPAHLADDAERRERFKREAKIISSLSHPNICALYDVGVHDSIQYLVMEYVEGETLERRLERGRLPLAQALEYLVQIADALDKAHRRGVIHRDLKPANVMLTKSGVKLLDFGLAARQIPPGGIIDLLTTNNSHRLTVEGRIMGTVQYMSPEQLQGKSPDTRADIFAFGGVAYEMITGKRAFEGVTQAEVIGAILKDDPQPIVAPDMPVPVLRTIGRCLTKDPDERWQTTNDLLFQLRGLSAPSSSNAAPIVALPRLSRRIERAAWIAVAITSIGIALYALRTRDNRTSTSTIGSVPIRFPVAPAEGTFLSGSDPPFALAPNGRHLAYAGTGVDGIARLWLRALDSDRQRELPGTERASSPFWSPDSEWVGFFAANTLKKVRASTGLVQIVASDVWTFGGASWSVRDVIVFPTGSGTFARVSAAGGPVSLVEHDEGGIFWPQFLPDGDHFIYAVGRSRTLGLRSRDGVPPRTLMTFPVRVSALAYVPGYIFFVQDTTLFARPFDDQRLEFTGEAVRLLDGIPVTPPGRAPFSVSAAGVLAYWTYPIGTPAVLRWFERDGRSSPAIETPAQYLGFALSPDGQKLVYSRIARMGGADLWLKNLASNGEAQLTFDGAAFTPQWSPDGSRIAFSGPGSSPPPKLFVKSATNANPASVVVDLTIPNFASTWSGDGHAVIGVHIDPANHLDLWAHWLEGQRSERLPFDTRFNESHGKVSPDNKWIAYVTDQSGRDEVWVASFPRGEIRQRVSAGTGTSPQWCNDGREIIYLSNNQDVMSAPFHGEPSAAEVGTPRSLFQIKDLVEVDRRVIPTTNAYVASPDGKRFLAAVRARDPNAPPITIVAHWPALLAR
jgi:serine/threonine protein kinase